VLVAAFSLRDKLFEAAVLELNLFIFDEHDAFVEGLEHGFLLLVCLLLKCHGVEGLRNFLYLHELHAMKDSHNVDERKNGHYWQ